MLFSCVLQEISITSSQRGDRDMRKKNERRPTMAEKSAIGVQTAPSRQQLKTGKTESISERIERLYGAISRRAYELFERDGRVDGNDQRHWLEAEREFLLPMQTSLEE